MTNPTANYNVKFSCPSCGDSLAWDADIKDDAPIFCQSCGAKAGSLAEFKELARTKVLEDGKFRIREALNLGKR